MTAILNRVQLIENIGVEPETIHTKEGNTFITASIATNESFKQNDELGFMVERYSLFFFGSMIEVTEYLHKGSQVYVEGKLRSSEWVDASGKSHNVINFVLTNIQLLNPEKAKQD